jgi:hypothetical protein
MPVGRCKDHDEDDAHDNHSYGVTPPPPGFLLLVQGLRLGAQLHRCCERGIEVALIARLQ